MIQRYWHIALIALIGLAVFQTGCNRPFASARMDFENGCWSMHDTLTLSFDNNDTAKVYRFVLPMTLTEDYPYNNLHLRALVIPPQGEVTVLPARFSLMTPDGHWLSEDSGSEIPFELLVSNGLRFNQTGNYTVRLYHYMREAELCGVKEAGIEIAAATEGN